MIVKISSIPKDYYATFSIYRRCSGINVLWRSQQKESLSLTTWEDGQLKNTEIKSQITQPTKNLTKRHLLQVWQQRSHQKQRQKQWEWGI